ncbi:MAG: type VI secretion system contractile sheath large subunit [Deltaproteobacteria bacterium]|jgi:type VI secretion system protein ImpC|nr:type VI secretion system contractile sheath large subunit [Deltaproteobacteria bacterium]
MSSLSPLDPLSTGEELRRGAFQNEPPFDLASLEPLEKTGLGHLLKWLNGPSFTAKPQSLSTALVDGLIGRLEAALAAQVDEILRAPKFLALERIWRSLDFLIQRVDFKENVKIVILNASKADLLEDFLDSPEIAKSGLYRLAYVAEYGQFGGEPLAAIVCDYQIDNAPDDYKLLERAAEIGAATHAPFLFGISPKFFGLKCLAEFDQIRDLTTVFSQKTHARFQALRRDENSRYLALVWPRFLTRAPYAPEMSLTWPYREKLPKNPEEWPWGSAAFALALTMAKSFERYRFSVNIIGENGGGLIANLLSLPVVAQNQKEFRSSVEYSPSDNAESALAQEGVITLMGRRDPKEAVFLTANSVLKPKEFAEAEGGAAATLSHRLSSQLPYLMLINRLAHYLKVIQRENLGGWKGPAALEADLNKWLNQFVTDMDNPGPQVRGRHPLRRAKATVIAEPGQPGWHRVSLTIRPHFKRLGASFDLSLTGPLEKLDW